MMATKHAKDAISIQEFDVKFGRTFGAKEQLTSLFVELRLTLNGLTLTLLLLRLVSRKCGFSVALTQLKASKFMTDKLQ